MQPEFRQTFVRQPGSLRARQKLFRSFNRIQGRLNFLAQLRKLVVGLLDQLLRAGHSLLYRIHRISAPVVTTTDKTGIRFHCVGKDEQEARNLNRWSEIVGLEAMTGE